MPWKECHVMDERLRFVARLLEGEKMAPLCAAFGISRKTGYKIFERYKDCGVAAFTDRSRRPYRQANRLPAQLEAVIVRLKREYPGWGAPKIREQLRRQASAPQLPAISTVHAVLDRHGLVKRRRRRRPGATGTALSRPTEPNALWCADYKGEFMLGDRRYCYPLTITDFASRYLLTCEALSTTQELFAFTVFERTFKEFGLPHAIRTDNGVPFASGQALYGLSKLAVWWLRLGIELERTKPGHPEQNGRHERMHLTLKREATKPAAANVFQAHLFQGAEGESQSRLRRSERRGHAGGRAGLARHLHALRFGLLRR
jgi:putative transposase